MGGVNVIVSCTKRKTREPRATLRLRDLPAASPVEERAAEWLRRLRAERSDLVPAGELYSGDHWKIVRTVAEQPVRLWVCSAGYGLVTPDSQLAPYDATFTPGQPDSVLREGGTAARTALPRWWASLGAWRGPQGAGLRSIAAVAETYPDDFLLVVLSNGYLNAVAEDLRQAAAALSDPDQLAVICAGADTLPGLEPHLLPCDARLQAFAGGALASLNVRLGLRLLESIRKELSLSRCRAMFRRWMSDHPKRTSPARAAMTDEDVRAFIRQAITEAPTVRPTALLQRLRRAGKACEHSRFIRLFHEVKGLSHAAG